MPEEKKEEKKKPNDVFAEMAYYLLPLLLLIFIISYISAHINFSWWESLFYRALESTIYLLFFAMFALSVSVFGFVLYSYKLSNLLSGAQVNFKMKQVDSNLSLRNERWERISGHIASDHPNDWRIAILEADVILDEILSKAGYTGDTVADKLKQVEKSDFLTIENAWEAHKVRNKIVHDAEFVLSRREADRVLDLYRSVFEEFHFI